MRTTNLARINSEFLSKKNWKEFYQWGTLARKGNTEIISDLLLKNFHNIEWSNIGLRKNIFLTKDHRGYCELKGGIISPFNEKRFCRAVFNEYNKTPNPLLGLFLDYEIPLTARNQIKDDKLNQGDIDLLSCRENELLFIEAKIANNNDSLLRAILEIFVYVMRIKIFGLLPQFLLEYRKPENITITPCVLTFMKSASGEQLTNIIKYPTLIKLINKINNEFNNNGINELEYYIVDDPDQGSSSWLNSEQVDGKNFKITFANGIGIKQMFIPK